MEPIPVRYNLGVGVVLLASAVFVFGVGVLLAAPMQLGLGALQLLVAAGFLARPWFLVHGDRIELKNLLGVTMKTHRFEHLSELEVSEGRVRSRSGAFKPLGGWLARAGDLQLVQAAVEGAPPAPGGAR